MIAKRLRSYWKRHEAIETSPGGISPPPPERLEGVPLAPLVDLEGLDARVAKMNEERSKAAKARETVDLHALDHAILVSGELDLEGRHAAAFAGISGVWAQPCVDEIPLDSPGAARSGDGRRARRAGRNGVER